jgi:SPP1 family holin
MLASKSTIIRTLVLLILLVNQGVFLFTGNTLFVFDEAQIEEYVTYFVTVAAAIWAWWKNNSFTRKAVESDEYLKNSKLKE